MLNSDMRQQALEELLLVDVRNILTTLECCSNVASNIVRALTAAAECSNA
jgi:hypothetical protein